MTQENGNQIYVESVSYTHIQIHQFDAAIFSKWTQRLTANGMCNTIRKLLKWELNKKRKSKRKTIEHFRQLQHRRWHSACGTHKSDVKETLTSAFYMLKYCRYFAIFEMLLCFSTGVYVIKEKRKFQTVHFESNKLCVEKESWSFKTLVSNHFPFGNQHERIPGGRSFVCYQWLNRILVSNSAISIRWQQQKKHPIAVVALFNIWL